MKLVEKLGANTLFLIGHLGEVTQLAFQAIAFSFKKPFSVKNLIYQMVTIGFGSIPVALITALTVGMVLALQFGHIMEAKLGSAQFLGGVVGLSFVRELGPVLTALMVTGRIGSGIAAELGTMKVTEQIDALVTLSTNPVQYLAVPRLIASLSMFPALTIFSNIVGLIGGGMVVVLMFDQNVNLFMSNVTTYVDLNDVMMGLIKSFVFGGLMAIISCYQGFQTFGGAEGVGKSTTKAVVYSSLTIIISDYFMNAIFIRILKL